MYATVWAGWPTVWPTPMRVPLRVVVSAATYEMACAAAGVRETMITPPVVARSLRSRSVNAGDDRFGFGKVPAEWRAVDCTPDIRRHRVDHLRPRSVRARRYVLSIVVPQGDDALDTQEWNSEQPGSETDLDQHGGR
jgi:hypothetical protein